MRLLNFFLFLGCTSIMALPASSFAALNPGTFVATQIKGTVELLEESTGTKVQLKKGRTFSQGYTLSTGDDSYAFLLQSNGATIRVQPNSVLSITEFLQEPFNPVKGSYDKLPSDPSKSITRLTLDYGEVIANVKKLQSNSSYEVVTPVGIAGIRGTILVVSLEWIDGQLIMTVTSLDGVVEVTFDGLDSRTINKGESIRVIIDETRRTLPRIEGRTLSKEEAEKIYQLLEKISEQTTSLSTPPVEIDTTIISDGG